MMSGGQSGSRHELSRCRQTNLGTRVLFCSFSSVSPKLLQAQGEFGVQGFGWVWLGVRRPSS